MYFQGGSEVGAFDSPKLWTLSEETMLLDAVEQYGFGNWLVILLNTPIFLQRLFPK